MATGDRIEKEGAASKECSVWQPISVTPRPHRLATGTGTGSAPGSACNAPPGGGPVGSAGLRPYVTRRCSLAFSYLNSNPGRGWPSSGAVSEVASAAAQAAYGSLPVTEGGVWLVQALLCGIHRRHSSDCAAGCRCLVSGSWAWPRSGLPQRPGPPPAVVFTCSARVCVPLVPKLEARVCVGVW